MATSEMTGRRLWRTVLLGVCLAASALPAPALVPQDVVVVVNANAEGSEALGKYYCLTRDILQEQIVVLRTSASPAVDRDEYNASIRDPIRKFITANDLTDKIKCLALMWGVPVRVLGREMAPWQEQRVKVYRRERERLHGRLAVNEKLLETVGVKFPRPRTKTLRPVGKLFDEGAGGRLGKARPFEEFEDDVASALREKEAAAAKIKDAARRQIALRQCAAIRLDTFGLGSLIRALPAETIPGVPSRDDLQREIRSLLQQQAKLTERPETAETAAKRIELVRRLRGLVAAHKFCHARLLATDTANEDAAVDSELALLWESDGPLIGPRPNPMNWRLQQAKSRPARLPEKIIMTARIDGPTPRDALRIIKDSMAVESTGLKGKFYIDAGGKYKGYDVNLRNLAKLLQNHTKMPVVYDKRTALFEPGSCPDAALYVGWYGLQEYVPAFQWSRGAVGWHIASLEAMHLRIPKSDEWCVKMIQNGVTATLGAVNEPYLGAFPLPQDFFALLLTGRFTVAECYWRTVPTVSWRLTLIADPLYNPFRLRPYLSMHSLPPALTGRRE